MRKNSKKTYLCRHKIKCMNSLFINPVTINGVIYFASDFHLGAPNAEESKEREKRVLDWLNCIEKDITHLFLLGDIFDFWFEYRDVVPKGYFNFLAKLYQLREKGVEIFYFTGNHDMWVKDYFEKELGFKIFRRQQAFMINGKRCLVGHGDGLGPKEYGYKLIKRLFAFRPHIKFYGMLHPFIAFSLARFLSRKSRAMAPEEDRDYLGDEKETLTQYVLSISQKESIDYFIYGHRHLPVKKELYNGAIYYNTGDWLSHDSYIRMDNNDIELLKK